MLSAVDPETSYAVIAYDMQAPSSNTEVNAFQCEEPEDLWKNIERHQPEPVQHDKRKTRDWREGIPIDNELKSYLDRFLEMIE